MDRGQDAWRGVGDRFTSLGEHFRRHHERLSREEGADQPASEAVDESLRSMADAADRLVTSVGDAVRDPALQRDARRAADSLVDALETTFAELGTEFRKRIGRMPSPREPSTGSGADDVWETDDEGDPPPRA
ncbi:MAG: hypothetical protein M3N17_07860 [Actinomycetota bacterium]|nr:hypothetical protein [Actinomycetota bacterium]